MIIMLINLCIFALVLAGALWVVKLLLDMFPKIPPQMKTIALVIIGLIALTYLPGILGVSSGFPVVVTR